VRRLVSCGKAAEPRLSSAWFAWKRTHTSGSLSLAASAESAEALLMPPSASQAAERTHGLALVVKPMSLGVRALLREALVAQMEASCCAAQ